jgi:hypothetical protein
VLPFLSAAVTLAVTTRCYRVDISALTAPPKAYATRPTGAAVPIRMRGP